MSGNTRNLTERAPSLDRNGRAAYRVASTDWDVSTTVVEAVNEVIDGDLLTEGSVLYDVVDPDALNRIFEDRRGDGRIVFELRGCRVEVHADSDHVVYAPDDSGGSAASPVQSA